MFSSFKCVGYGSFRRGAAVTTEAAAGSIKAEQRRPRERRDQGKTEGRNPAKHRKKRKPRTKKKRTKSTEEPREINPETRGKNKVKNQSKKNIQREGENKRTSHTVTRIIFEIVLVPANKRNTRIHSKNTHSRPASS
jgi:hypothetical protein